MIRLTCRPAVMACIVAGSLAAPSARLQAQGRSYASPQEVFDAAKTSFIKKDFRTFTACLTPESQDMMAGGLVFMAGMVRAFKDMPQANQSAKDKADIANFEKVLNKHGLTDAFFKKGIEAKGANGKQPTDQMAMMRQLTAPIHDKPGFVADSLAALGPKINSGKPNPMSANSKLEKLKVGPASASGIVSWNNQGKPASEKMEFKKINGSWRIELPKGNGMAAGQRPPTGGSMPPGRPHN